MNSYWLGAGLSAIIFGSLGLLGNFGWRFHFLMVVSGIVYVMYSVYRSD